MNKEKRSHNWDEKALNGQYLRQTKEIKSEQSWTWLQNGDLKRETESLIVAAQNQTIRTNLVKVKIDKSQKDTLHRLCKKADESIDESIVVVANLHRRGIKEGMITWYIRNLQESVILKLEMSSMNMSQKMFWK